MRDAVLDALDICTSLPCHAYPWGDAWVCFLVSAIDGHPCNLCVRLRFNKEAFSVYIAVTAIETVFGNSNINVWHVAW